MKRGIYGSKALLLACLLLATSTGSVLAQTATPPLKVSGGAIVGTRQADVDEYLGVPFAAPPVGALRWRPPQPVSPWTGLRETRSFSPACAQNVSWVSIPKSEDCLYLNVWAPHEAKDLPVIVWIHGGAMKGGTPTQPNQHGANLAKRGAIVVSLNYRVGLFGFFAHPALSRESPDSVSGNQGIHDQIAALRWVKANIAAFGGDPGRVTIMGSSSGGESVAVLVASPLAKGLFHRAIAESGNDAVPISPEDSHRFTDNRTAEANGELFAKTAGAADLAALRAMSMEELQKHIWQPNVHIDGHLLRSDMTTTYRGGVQNDVPLLVGWNAEESKDLTGGTTFNAKNSAGLMGELLPRPPSPPILAAYPATTDAQAQGSMVRFVNDWWGWRMVHWARLQARYGRSSSYVYYFAHQPAKAAGPCYYACGAGHGVEIQYLFDNLSADPRAWDEKDRKLADKLAETVIAFANTGKPSRKGLPNWPAFDGSNASIHVIGDAPQLKAHPLPDFSLFASLP
ncbi:carboxylesterase/lipase family protein [Sphingobium sp. CCH11-B1]|uniref:carboxylesterase/lipase family protein n=1 Tax=Sphingobium sp. CCH11-B1 TaxID=1768781 RepID=UPI0009EB4582|nr:carboxylesterase family protein [Sphingobium sp. CCH11-B1]